ncbi:uncharacterized protein LOC142179550 [Nicotiana tabacum]|uniref:Uncharacterized protein LOC142179550 n=1 Tax=Nicotiana tabacum TaxID=4097 RepID=A0AC58UA59_TOBAC
MSSSNPNRKKVPILDQFPNAPVRHRRGGGSRPRTGLESTRGGSSGSSSRSFIPKAPSSKSREILDTSQEPSVDDIVPGDLSFESDKTSLQKQIKNLERADTYPTLVTELTIPTIRKDCNWKDSLRMSIPSPNQRISSFRNGYSSVYTYPFTLGFNPPIDPVILDFCRFFTICLAQIGPLVWRTVACLRYLSSKANVNFTFSHLIHLYHPNLIRHGVFTLTTRSKKVLVNPEDDRDRRWYIRYVAVRTVDLIGETNIPFPEKWNFEPTMGDVEPIPNFRGWVDSLLKIATREQRTWKSISSLHGWKVKTHGFGIRGMTTEVAMAIRMSANAALDLDKARALLPKRKATKESSEEEEEGTSLITRPRSRRRIIIDNEIENTPARTSATEPVLIQSDEDAEPRDNNESIQHLFDSGFGSGELGPVFDEAPLSSFVPISSIPLPAVSVSLPALTTSVCLPISTAPISVPLAASTAPASAPVLVSTSFPSIPSIPSAALLPSVHHTETGSSSGNMTMRSVTLEVLANHSLLRKTNRADVWLEPLIGDIEKKKKMESHSCLTLMNDVVHSTLKVFLPTSFFFKIIFNFSFP